MVENRPKQIDVAAHTTFYLSDDTFIEPDFVLYPEQSGLEKLSPETVLLAIEIADSSLEYDLGQKAQIYARSGVGEMWVINARSLQTTIHRRPSGGAYGEVRTVEKGGALEPGKIAGLTVNMRDYS